MKKVAIALLAAGIAFSGVAGSAMASSANTTSLERVVGSVLGVDYQWGGTTRAGFDCSGFTSFIFKKVGIDLPRTSRDQAEVGVKVAKADLRPGDLVFFNTNGKGISHLGIYMGEGKFAHSSSKYGVKISSLSESYYVKRYVTARRILGEDLYKKFATVAPQSVAEESTVEVASAPVAPKITSPDDPVASVTEAALLALEEAQETAAKNDDVAATSGTPESDAPEGL